MKLVKISEDKESGGEEERMEGKRGWERQKDSQ